MGLQNRFTYDGGTHSARRTANPRSPHPPDPATAATIGPNADHPWHRIGVGRFGKATFKRQRIGPRSQSANRELHPSDGSRRLRVPVWGDGTDAARDRLAAGCQALLTCGHEAVPKSIGTPFLQFVFSCVAELATTASPARTSYCAPRWEGFPTVYKLLLCVRYLQTRYLAFICIVSVMLGVATLIVVNSVMSGFSTKLRDRLHGMMSDVVMDTERMEGFVKCDREGYPILDPITNLPIPLSPEEITKLILSSPAGDKIEAITPTIEVFAILQHQYRGQMMTKPVRVIGIDSEGRAAIGGYSEFLVRQKNSTKPNFELTPEAMNRFEWNKRQREPREAIQLPPPPKPGALPEPDMLTNLPIAQAKPFGIIPGYTIAHMRFKNDNGETVEEQVLHPGDDVTVTTVGGADLRPVWGTFLVSDYIKTEMSEYDQGIVYVPLEQLQKIRGMTGRCTAIQIKLKNYEKDKKLVTDEMRKIFVPQSGISVDTWEGRQGPLLAAIDVERSILNLLLFMIVGVAGFSILAIFTMIVSEKYRDIGILKSLGASSQGIMVIFLGYGLLLGTVGCMCGTALGLWFTKNINFIEQKLTQITGAEVFPRNVYYFKEIPTNVEMMNVLWVNVGALTIAVVFSLLPAYRAARLHPVRALRFE